MENNSEHPTTKIPDFILLKEAIKENKKLLLKIGQLEAEIDHLNHINEVETKKELIILNNENVKEIQKEKMYSLLKKRNNFLSKRVNSQRKTISELSAKLIQYQNKNIIL